MYVRTSPARSARYVVPFAGKRRTQFKFIIGDPAMVQRSGNGTQQMNGDGGNDPRLRGSGGQGGGRAQDLPIVAGIPVLICKGAGREPTDDGMLGCGDKRWPLSDV